MAKHQFILEFEYDEETHKTEVKTYDVNGETRLDPSKGEIQGFLIIIPAEKAFATSWGGRSGFVIEATREVLLDMMEAAGVLEIAIMPAPEMN